MKSVLFVCLGNICRSPTAQVTFEALLDAQGKRDRYQVDSAGTGDWHAGERADPRTRQAALARGLEITHRSRQITQDDLRQFDLIVVMDRQNLAGVLAIAPSDVKLVEGEGAVRCQPGTTGVALFASFLATDPQSAVVESDAASRPETAAAIETAQRTLEVPDPYSGGLQGFNAVLDICRAASRGLLASLESSGARER